MKNIYLTLLAIGTFSLVTEAAPVEGIRIAWDYSSATQLAPQGAYPRLRRLQDNSLMAVYESFDGNCVMIRSYDEGVNWSKPVILYTQFSYEDKGNSVLVNMTNPEIYQLTNGDILTGCNYRPASDGIAPYSIAIRRSTDNGNSWEDIQVLYEADTYFHNGCWEPSFLELPNGEVQVYFANESPYRESEEQEISILSSFDNGVTWTTESRPVSFRADRRDGMPVAEIFGDEIVTIIEDDYITQFKPYTVRTTIQDNWSSVVWEDSPNRAYTLKKPVENEVYMGAPYIIKLPTGEAVISYQTNEGRGDWDNSVMEVATGDKQARNFTNRSRPFCLPIPGEAKWNSLVVWDEQTIIALSSTNYRGTNVSPWMMKGYIMSDIRLNENGITDSPLFIGSKGNTQLKANINVKDNTLVVDCIVKDNTPYKNNEGSSSDGVFVYIDSLKIWSDTEGKTSCWERKNGEWTSIDMKDIQVKATSTRDGYELTFIIPQFNKKEFRMGLSLSAYEDASTGYVEHLANFDPDEPESGLLVKW